MSRGLGAVQQRVLAALQAHVAKGGRTFMLSIEIAGAVFETSRVSPSQDVATRRALRGLAKRGLIVQLPGSFMYGQHAWSTPEGADERARREARLLVTLTRLRQ